MYILLAWLVFIGISGVVCLVVISLLKKGNPSIPEDNEMVREAYRTGGKQAANEMRKKLSPPTMSPEKKMPKPPQRVKVSHRPEQYGSFSVMYAIVATLVEVIILSLGFWKGGTIVWMIGSAVPVALFAISIVFAVKGKKIKSPGAIGGLVFGVFGCSVCSLILLFSIWWNIGVVWNPNWRW